MLRRLNKFFDLLTDEGLEEAVSATYEWIKYDWIKGRLVVSGPPTISHALYVKMYQPFLERKIGSGIDVMEKDWDNLILLDSYRADYFREHSSLEGELSTVVSKGNWSLEFVVNNFQGSKHHDTVVITANPCYQAFSKLDESAFHTLINLGGIDGRKERMKQVTDSALEAIEEYPNKRVIVHYMQPHAPHMGETSDRFRNDLWKESFPRMFTLYQKGLISQEVLEQSYLDTIRVIEDEIQRLLEKLEGKTVVSSDHGENLGEIQHGMTQLDHGNPTPECRYVPWLEMEYDDRKEITEDPPIGFDSMDEQTVEERLAALGYK